MLGCFFVAVVSALTAFVALRLTPGTGEQVESEIKTVTQKCVESGGNWLEEYQECENVDKLFCISNGGEFNECASACRHEPSSAPCTLQCVFVCSFE